MSLKDDENWLKLCEISIARNMWDSDPYNYCDVIIEECGLHDIQEVEITHLRTLIEEHGKNKLYEEFLRRSRIVSKLMGDLYPPKILAETECKNPPKQDHDRNSGWRREGFVWKNRRTKIWREVKKGDGPSSDIKQWEYMPRLCCTMHFQPCGCRSKGRPNKVRGFQYGTDPDDYMEILLCRKCGSEMVLSTCGVCENIEY